MRVLLLGKSGLLGSEFPSLLTQAGIEFLAPSHHELDVTHFDEVDRFMAREYFDKIIYCIAYTDVDKAEMERGLCEQLNVKALENILTHKRPIVHFSSEYVFNAPANVAVSEETKREPINFYGETKLRAEQALEKSGVSFWNIRTSWLFGTGKENFVTRILKKSLEEDVIEVVADQVGRPTYAKDLAEFVFRHFILSTLESGHYHLQNSGDGISWADFAEYFLQKRGWQGEIRNIASTDLIRPARRPLNSLLRNTKLPEVLRNWHEAVDEFLSISN
ncbi:NAD(P)-dependent oxidoreductase [Candidatus Gracilibacteria bacterium]|nr:NAD(P)-dependent oxidoreductase [Candidatus Gracilibacteria bacterium]